jgi:Flp pilus assembly pilin Flp
MAVRVRDSLVVAWRRATLAAAQSTTGSVAIEYGLIAGIVSIAIIAGAIALGSALDAYYQAFASYF